MSLCACGSQSAWFKLFPRANRDVAFAVRFGLAKGVLSEAYCEGLVHTIFESNKWQKLMNFTFDHCFFCHFVCLFIFAVIFLFRLVLECYTLT